MPNVRTPRGITPPAPGLEREEPTFVPEADLPDGERRISSRTDRAVGREERPVRGTDRE